MHTPQYRLAEVLTTTALAFALLLGCQPKGNETPPGGAADSAPLIHQPSGPILLPTVYSQPAADTLLAPLSEHIALVPGKLLFFRSIDGAFSLDGGDTLYVTWGNGVICLNGRRFRPSSVIEEYSRWQRFLKKPEDDLYARVPFLLQRLAVYGNSEAGRASALHELDSTMSSLELEAQRDLRRRLSLAQCKQRLLDRDSNHLIDSVVTRHYMPAGMLVHWRGLPQPSLVQETFPEPGALLIGQPRAVLRSEATMTVQFFRRVLEHQFPLVVEIQYGNISTHSAPGSVRRDQYN